jgi:uncharacterized protein YukJ
MQDPNYGSFRGAVVDHGPQPGGNPHYDLFLQANGKRYRVPFNMESVADKEDAPPELQYFFDENYDNPVIARLRDLPDGLTLHSEGGPALDFVRGGVVDLDRFRTLPAGAPPENNEMAARLKRAAARAQNEAGQGAFIIAFGMGFPAGGGGAVPTHASAFQHYQGLHNVHMNQGNYFDQRNPQFFRENGPDQDGALFFFFADGTCTALFTKFQSQDKQTFSNGRPVHATAADAARDEVAAAPVFAAPLVAATAPAPTRFFFADPSPGPGEDDFHTPNDSDRLYDDPEYKQRLRSLVQPFHSPRLDSRTGAPRLRLADVVGVERSAAVERSGRIVFHACGDTGASEKGMIADETRVAGRMAADLRRGAPADRPVFFYHLGDVVYHFGEDEFYYDQFYEPFRTYDAPIFAIPGNHDGMVPRFDDVSLQAFYKHFCGERPTHADTAGGLARTTMTQPGVYFTLEAPFVSILGLYSNTLEGPGVISSQRGNSDPHRRFPLTDEQTDYLRKELSRLKPLREQNRTAVLLAVHHPPYSFDGTHGDSLDMLADIDAACRDAGLWPDAVLSGHAHLYQRIVRRVSVPGEPQPREIPYLIAGSGGHATTRPPRTGDIDLSRPYSPPGASHTLYKLLRVFGYLRVTVTDRTLGVQFYSTEKGQAGGGEPADSCTLDLRTHRVG